MTILTVIGYGYSAKAFLTRARPRYERVIVTTRNASGKEKDIEEQGVERIAFDGLNLPAALQDALETSDHLLVTAPPDEAGDPLLHLTPHLPKSLKTIVYLSTVGVYGDHNGAWVDETTPCRPVSPRSRQRLTAEEQWRQAARGRNLAILRLSGIYGPGRNALLNMKNGTARRLVKPNQVFNRIHVDDIALAIEQAFAQNFSGTLNVTDDEPAPPQDVVAFAASLLGMEAPPEIPFATARLTEMQRSFYSENKKVSNAALKRKLGINLAHPHYRDALLALAAMGDGSGAEET